MEVIEIILLIVTYTLLIISLVFQYICYKKNIEFIETIAFTISLLLLVISFTASYFFGLSKETASVPIPVLISMVLVGLTTPINILKDREHKIPDFWRKALIVVSSLLIAIIIICYFLSAITYAEYLVIPFVGISVTSSMLLIRATKPIKRFSHKDKIERIIAMIFLIVVPLCLIGEFYISEYYSLKMGFVLPLAFIILTAGKIWDDWERLSLLKSNTGVSEQQLRNYMLTPREKEIAICLAKGMTYKQIAEQLYIAIPTVKTHSSNIYKKCGVKNKNELTYLLIR